MPVVANATLLKELTERKQLLFETILSDRECVNLLTNSEDHPLPALDLRYTQVFPYAWIDDTIQDAKTFLCFDLDVPRISNIAVKSVNLYIWMFSHKSLMPTRFGIRTDLLASRVDTLLNGSTEFGFGKLSLSSVTRLSPNTDYYGRALKYTVLDWNRFGTKL